MDKKIFDNNGKELFTYKINICVSPRSIEYLAESEKECRSLFLENNEDLDEYDLKITKVGELNE